MVADCPVCRAPLTVSPAYPPNTPCRCGDCRAPLWITSDGRLTPAPTSPSPVPAQEPHD